MRWVPLCLLLLGCPRGDGGAQAPDASALIGARSDAGPVVTLERLDAWLRWQAALSGLPPLVRADGGVNEALRGRARAEAALLADAGLRFEEADAIEAVVAGVVAERNVAKLTGADVLLQFRSGVQQLAPEQRKAAEAALSELQAKSPVASLAGLEAVHGPEAVRVVLTREAEVTRTWDALMDARGEQR